MTITAATNLGRSATLTTIYWAAGVYIVLSWVVFFLVPEFGLMEEPILGGGFVTRMSGLSHPNTLGQFAAITSLLGICFYLSGKTRSWFSVALILMALAALLGSYSRSSMMALIVALLATYRNYFFKRENLQGWVVLIGVSIVGVMILSTQMDIAGKLQEKSAILSKSGDSEELTTATGRAEIWAKSIDLIASRPAIGYGPTSSKYLLDDYSYYTHNLILNVGLNCGVLGLLAAAMMCLSRLGMLFSRRSLVADGLAVFILCNGVFENVIFSNLCGLPTICWVLALVWFKIDDGESD